MLGFYSSRSYKELPLYKLDGPSLANVKQQARDAVKDAAFAKSGLQLVRIENGQMTKNRVLGLLKPHLKLVPVMG